MTKKQESMEVFDTLSLIVLLIFIWKLVSMLFFSGDATIMDYIYKELVLIHLVLWIVAFQVMKIAK